MYGFPSPRSALDQYRIGDQFDSLGDTHWYQDKIVQITENRHKVWNQINGTKGISDDAANEKFCIPQCSGVTRSKVKSKGLCPETTRTLSEFCEYCWVFLHRHPSAIRKENKDGAKNEADHQELDLCPPI